MGKLVFDLDNTLYSFEATGIHHRLHQRIGKYLEDHLKLSPADAEAMSNDYYSRYGLTARGLLLHHDDVDVKHYCDIVHDCGAGDIVKRDEPLRAMLEELAARGWELWIFTNANMMHAEIVLEALGVRDLFGDRLVDSFAQWENTVERTNKPEAAAYDFMQKRTGHAPHQTIVMIEDTMVNLRAPAERGWIPVWIAHGRETPKEAVPGLVVVETVHTLAQALKDVPLSTSA